MNTPFYYDQYRVGQTPNPWFNVANQFIPRNLHDLVRWSRFILLQSPTVAEVLRKMSTYPITSFIPDTKNEKELAKINKIIKSLKLKSKLNDIGFDWHAEGNVFVSIYFPIQRNLICPHCNTVYMAKHRQDLKFSKYQYRGPCTACGVKDVKYLVKDTKSLNIDDINIVKWSVNNMVVHDNPITGEAEYYYHLPGDVKKRIMLGDRLFVDSIPQGFIDAVRENRDFKFSRGSVFHLKDITMGSIVGGLGIPRILPLFSLVFYQSLLRKANEAIATEHLTPLRVLFPQMGSANADPVTSMSMKNFVGTMTENMARFKQDPNRVVFAPGPIGYQNIGGEGKTLLVAQEIEMAEQTILMGMGVSQELLSGTTNWTSSAVGLRLLENSMKVYSEQIQELIDWIFENITQYLGMPDIKVSMTDFKLTDNDTVRALFAQLTEGGEVSMTTLFDSFGWNYAEELTRLKKDAVAKARNQVEIDKEIERVRFEASRQADDSKNNSPVNDAKRQARSICTQLMDMPPEYRNKALAEVNNSDQSLFQLVVSMLPEYGINPETLSNTVQDSSEGVSPDEGGGQKEESTVPAKANKKQEKEKGASK